MTLWQNLTHDTIFNSLEETLQVKLSNICIKRNSYINRVYELEEFDSHKRFIVKFYRPKRWTFQMIQEEHLFLKELSADEVSVIPPIEINGKTLFTLFDIFYAIFPKKGGRAIDEFNQEGWETLGRILAKVHTVGEKHKNSIRIKWRPSVATKHHLQVLLETNYLLSDFKDSFIKTVELFINKFDPLFENQELILIHGDCHKGNLIHRPNEGIFVIDFDDICVGPPVQDLWMLLPDVIENSKRELEWFLKGYETFRVFNKRSLELAEPLRGMRIIHYIAWLAIQSGEPDFQKHFPDSGTPKYWSSLIKDLQGIIY
ncbi:hypothetical protein A3J90_05075 [candidate division WOR-1 bacterium RIFOXYC2_FULL_37_10]|uniref:Aminoglycoside phosphotransferase domain-containing protein n=1 Tax=candidate division WOR-1 bacterium RIFOXYB2_FULL_37_13 TaxID=1802579 RepID=A0A1F4SNV4_UNCSA|nr:MAG: hypothetical protein A2246_06645 [candidate division WOR-1 bacterium RIFOXYA2_FULL_37_7]OGC22128.1 MAG: hypothetical protein A2310_03965 [candidate division WOR-1 bacterium RIFOXYB2_FULL_37_13]OGC34434.1 MAG: hypothetical protein A3J90_05075 [candidate division WOR-1 bacterium RIFOXYC2_FULL_37_10]